MKINLYIGHDVDRQGAEYYGVTEFMVASALVQHIDHPSIFVLPEDLALVDTVKHANSSGCDLAVELHFNAGGKPNTEGCETLYCPGSTKGKRAAEAFQRAYIGAEAKHGCEARDRGAKEGWYRMEKNGTIDYFLRKTAMPALILEPEFIQQAWGWYDDPIALAEVAQSLTAGLLAAAGEL